MVRPLTFSAAITTSAISRDVARPEAIQTQIVGANSG